MSVVNVGCSSENESKKVDATQPIAEATYTPSTVTKKRCKAITKKGTQCKRNAKKGSDYCWQHQPSR